MAALPVPVPPRVRDARREDFHALLQIERASYPSAWTRRQLVRMLAHAGSRSWVIDLAGRVAGFLVLIDEGQHWHLANLAVAPDLRRRGLGLLALRTVDERVATWPHPRVILHVRESNLPAQLLYRRAGYRAVEILPRYYSDEPAYRMEKDLGR